MASRIDIHPDARILVVDVAFIGDLLMSTPALANLRRAFQRARIEILVSPGSLPVIEDSSLVDRAMATGMKSGGWESLRNEAKRISSEGYDLAISFHRGHGTLLMLKMAGIRRRIGFTNGGRGLFLTDGIPFQLYRHRAWNHIRLIEECLQIEADYSVPTTMPIDPEAARRVDEILGREAHGRELVAINPNAAWPTKRWLPEGFAALADGLSSHGFLPVLTGSESEKPIAEEMKSLMKTQALDLTGRTTLKELAAVLARCALLVTNDSGPMHVAQAVGIPVVPIFGPTDPSRCGPWLSRIAPLQTDIDCIKCYRKRCWHMTCMRLVDKSKVYEAAELCIRKGANT